MRWVHRHAVCVRVALQECNLSCGEILLVLFEILRGDREQRFLIWERIDQRFAFDVAGGQVSQAAGPRGNCTRLVASSFCADRREFVAAQACRLFGSEFRDRVLRQNA
jgi:hypothetical protein